MIWVNAARLDRARNVSMKIKQCSHRVPLFAALCGALLAGGCQTTEPAPTLVSKSDVINPPDFVAAACGDCHGMVAAFDSPDPDAPSFASIANREGVNEETLSAWLIDAHNYPETMDFELRDSEVREVVEYMLTLQREDYVPNQ